MIKSPFCMPRLHRPAPKGRISPMSLFHRLREAIFRLIMLSSAISNAKDTGGSIATASPGHDRRCSNQSYYYSMGTNDPLHSEAVADCIEFIKKSSATAAAADDGHGMDSAAGVNLLVV